MRMLTIPAFGLALALPLAVASVPAHADNGDYDTQHTNTWNRQNDTDHYQHRADQDQNWRDNQRADTGRDTYDRDRDHAAGGQYSQDEQYRHDTGPSESRNSYERDRQEQYNGRQAMGDQRDGTYSQRDRHQYDTGSDSHYANNPPYDHGDSGNHD